MTLRAEMDSLAHGSAQNEIRTSFSGSKISMHAVDVPYCSYASVMNADRSLYSVLVINKPKKDINNQH
jgi:hypothetical protein